MPAWNRNARLPGPPGRAPRLPTTTPQRLGADHGAHLKYFTLTCRAQYRRRQRRLPAAQDTMLLPSPLPSPARAGAEQEGTQVAPGHSSCRLWPLVLAMATCLGHDHLSWLWPLVLAMATCLGYGHLSCIPWPLFLMALNTRLAAFGRWSCHSSCPDLPPLATRLEASGHSS